MLLAFTDCAKVATGQLAVPIMFVSDGEGMPQENLVLL